MLELKYAIRYLVLGVVIAFLSSVAHAKVVRIKCLDGTVPVDFDKIKRDRFKPGSDLFKKLEAANADKSGEAEIEMLSVPQLTLTRFWIPLITVDNIDAVEFSDKDDVVRIAETGILSGFSAEIQQHLVVCYRSITGASIADALKQLDPVARAEKRASEAKKRELLAKQTECFFQTVDSSAAPDLFKQCQRLGVLGRVALDEEKRKEVIERQAMIQEVFDYIRDDVFTQFAFFSHMYGISNVDFRSSVSFSGTHWSDEVTFATDDRLDGDYGLTYLAYAAMSGAKDCVGYLLWRGADIKALPTGKGPWPALTPLGLAEAARAKILKEAVGAAPSKLEDYDDIIEMLKVEASAKGSGIDESQLSRFRKIQWEIEHPTPLKY